MYLLVFKYFFSAFKYSLFFTAWVPNCICKSIATLFYKLICSCTVCAWCKHEITTFREYFQLVHSMLISFGIYLSWNKHILNKLYLFFTRVWVLCKNVCYFLCYSMVQGLVVCLTVGFGCKWSGSLVCVCVCVCVCVYWFLWFTGTKFV